MKLLLAIAIVLACLLGGLMIAVYEAFDARTVDVAVHNAPTVAPIGAAAQETPPASVEASPTEDSHAVDDDGKTLWASPTSGPPLELAYLPPGCQMILALRPAALADHPEFEKVVDSLGPAGRQGVDFLGAKLHDPDGVESVLVGWRVVDGRWQTSMVARLTGRSAAEHIALKLPGAVREEYGKHEYVVDGQWAYFLPSGGDPARLVVAPPEAMREIIDLGGSPPPLRRDVERLLAHTDAERQMTLIVAPNFLFSEGQGMFGGQFAAVRRTLFWFLGDTLSAAAVSCHWGEDFFTELLAVPTLDEPPAAVARQLSERVAQMPGAVEEYVARLKPGEYGRRVVERFPAMVRALAAYTRSGVAKGCVVLRCSLPAVAGHNLIMGAELTLAEAAGSGAPGEAALATEASTRRAQSVSEALSQRTTLKSARDSLESVLRQLADDIGVEIVAVGPDLQADGITRNQLLDVAIEDRPAEEILVEILRRANPDKSAGGPADERQRLVYVVKRQRPDGPEAIYITTRAAAAERGETLPAVFGP